MLYSRVFSHFLMNFYYFGNDLVILACWRPAGAWLAIHRCAAIFKPDVPLINLWYTHSIVSKSHHNLLNGFHLAVAQFLAKFEAVVLLQSFCHFPYNENLTKTLNAISLKCCFPSTDAIDRQEKMHTCVWRFKVTSCKCVSLKSTRFSQTKMLDIFVTDLI